MKFEIQYINSNYTTIIHPSSSSLPSPYPHIPIYLLFRTFLDNFFNFSLVLHTIHLHRLGTKLPSVIHEVEKIYWRLRPDATLRMRWMHLAQAVQDAYNDFKRDVDSDSRQVTLFYHKFQEYEIKPGEPDRTPPCRSQKEKIKKEIQSKLL